MSKEHGEFNATKKNHRYSHLLAAFWASEIVTNGRDQCTIVQLHVRPKKCNYHDIKSGLLLGLCKVLLRNERFNFRSWDLCVGTIHGQDSAVVSTCVPL